ncbi:hypothetical protein [Streptomyces sp. NBC_00078]|uniref:recombination directionality factor n=1 Tax=unclassified Streptomyces TaxID=2593676 RepID=UPI00224DFEFC|nr:hypothetical protein [Streptomyces sp. NBC_00078]MCX5423169.1 hypothetical protein [Streptomyces sp. NBC_00078]
MPPRESAGRFHAGRFRGHRPEGLRRWRITSAHLGVIERLEGIFGGEVGESKGADSCSMELLTAAERIEIIIEDVESLNTEMLMWGRSGVLHHCDGVRFLSPREKVGDFCGCPAPLDERRSHANAGTGPQPSTEIRFRVAQLPDLGEFGFRSSSWEFMESADVVKAGIPLGSVKTLCELSLEPVEFKMRSGQVVAGVAPSIRAVAADVGNVAERRLSSMPVARAK